MKKALVGTSFIASGALALTLAMPAQAYTSKRSSWRECTSTQSGLSLSHSYTVDTRYSSYPAGTYYIKSEIRWDLNKSGYWRKMDHHTVTSASYKINPGRRYTIYSSNGDRTTWGAAYNRWWQAHVIVRLMRVRTGPDQTVIRDDYYFSRSRFVERGSDCGLTFSG